MDRGQLAESLAEWIEAKPVWSPVIPVDLPAADDDPEPDGLLLGDAEGQTFMIEYRDSKGLSSRRRITVWHLTQNERTGIPSLYAKCHERNAMRQFRIDRIQCCIDFDGEIHDDVPRYISESFGMATGIASRRLPSAQERWENIINAVRADAALLAAMARCDGHAVPAEVEAILVYLATIVEENGDMLTDDEIRKLDHFLARLRPTPKSIARALATASGFPPQRLRKLLIAAAKVMDADERRHPAEARLINILSQELLGITLV